jgi:hypothetical protein
VGHQEDRNIQIPFEPEFNLQIRNYCTGQFAPKMTQVGPPISGFAGGGHCGYRVPLSVAVVFAGKQAYMDDLSMR